MDIKQLKTFLVASEILNFTATAQQLDYAQSSITAQIKALEQELGAPLFERLGKKVTLTQTGRSFQVYARQMLRLHDDMRTQLTSNSEQLTLIIGAQESQCTYRLPAILAQFKTRYPKSTVVFKPVHSTEIALQLLQQGELDMAIITDIDKETHYFQKLPLIEEKLALIYSNDQSIQVMEDLTTHTLLLTEQGCSYRQQLEHVLTQHQLYAKQTIEFMSIEAIKQCTIAGLGISFLPEMVVARELAEGLLCKMPLQGMTPIQTQLIWHQDKQLQPHMLEFIKLVQHAY